MTKQNTQHNQMAPQMTIQYTKDTRRGKEERAFFKNRVKKAFLQWLYYRGVLPWKELPSFLDVHHKHPLGGGGTNDFSNLVIITKETHNIINRTIIDPQLEGIKEGETRTISVPDWDSYIDWSSIDEYLHNVRVWRNLARKPRNLSIKDNFER